MTKTKCQQELEEWCNNKKKYSGGQECLPIDNWWMVWQAAWEASQQHKQKEEGESE